MGSDLVFYPTRIDFCEEKININNALTYFPVSMANPLEQFCYQKCDFNNPTFSYACVDLIFESLNSRDDYCKFKCVGANSTTFDKVIVEA